MVHVTAPAPFGGLERVVAGLARETAARGHRVMLVAVLSPGAPVPAWATALASAGVRVEARHLPNRAYLRERREVRALLRDFGADVVHTHGYRSDVLHLGVAHGLRRPIVSTAHGFASTRPKGDLYERLQLLAWRRFDAVVAVSTPLVDRIAAAGVPRSRIAFIRNGWSPGGALAPAGEARARLELPAAGPVIGWVGRLSDEKHPLLAVEALAHVAGATLCFIGTGPLRAAAEARAAELGLGERVRFAGAVADAAPLFTAFDTLLLSSRTEGTPMVVLEAAAAGVPVASTAVGGVPDLLGEGAGWLAPSGDALALAAAIRESLGDRAEASRRASRLQERLATKGGEADWVAQYLALYDRLISANPSGRA